MTELLIGYYLGLVIFSLNGLLLVGLRNRQIELRAQEQRLHRLLLRLKVRGRK